VPDGTDSRSTSAAGRSDRQARVLVHAQRHEKLTGREPAHSSGIEPAEIRAHQPKMMSGMGKFQQAVRNGNSVDERLRYLVELQGAQMIGCDFCVDLGSQICRDSGFSDDELLAFPDTARAICSPSVRSSYSITRSR
jgi:alkylhydroperoxidase family enzyme